jgi:hypothetical protein
MPVVPTLDVESYLDFKTMTRYLKAVAQAAPHLVTVASIGKSREGRPLVVAEVSNGDGRAKPGIWIDGGHQGWNLLGSTACLELLRFLVAGHGRDELLTELVDGQAPGTTLLPDTSPMNARKQWLAGHLRMRGRLILDDGAARRLREAGSSLLPVGVVDVFGQFSRGEMVACEDRHGERVACGLVNYDAADARRLCGKKSHQIADVLGFMNEEELIHRDNMVVL